MINISITESSARLDKVVARVIKTNKPARIITDNGEAVIISDQEYRSMIEMAYIESHPKYKAKLLEALAEPREDCVGESEVEWWKPGRLII